MPGSPETFPHPSLRLFISVDIVGSTAYKQAAQKDGSADAHGQAWLQTFSGFFSDFEVNLQTQWDHSQSNLGNDLQEKTGDRPRFWKAAGDEVIYVQTITDVMQPLFTLATIRATINAYRPTLKKISPNLDLKAAAWLAGFPINNAEVVLGVAGDSNNLIFPSPYDDWFLGHLLQLKNYFDDVRAGKPPNGFLDFLGPQMDLGFRLSSRASPRRMMISADLALMLVDGFLGQKDKWTGRFDIKDQVYFDGTEPLKGVLSGVPYPLLWLDTMPGDPLLKAEDKVASRDAPSLDEIKDYCDAFIASQVKDQGWLMRPFVQTEGTVTYGSPPARHTRELAAMQERWSNAAVTLTDSQNPSEDPREAANAAAIAARDRIIAKIEKLSKSKK